MSKHRRSSREEQRCTIHVSAKRGGGGLKDKTVEAVLCFSASLTIVSTALSCLISSHTKQLIIRTMGLYSFIILETINWRSNVISVINCSAASGHLRDLFQLICSRRSSWRSQRDTKLLQTLGRMILFIFHRPWETYPDLYWWLKCTATIAEGLRRTSREKAPCCRQTPLLTFWTLQAESVTLIKGKLPLTSHWYRTLPFVQNENTLIQDHLQFPLLTRK